MGPRYRGMLALVVLMCSVPAQHAFTVRPNTHRNQPRFGKPASEFALTPNSQRLAPPPGFTAPEPKPLTVTGDWGTLISAAFALALRLGCGTTVVGWTPDISFAPPIDGEYALQLGPLYLKDSSAVLRGECARPTGRLVLYEFDSSPFCRKVRDACAVLDLEVLLLPCPGADGSGFSDEHFARTGRRTVPYLIDEGAGAAMFESEVIVNYLYRNYGPPGAAVPAALQGTLALVSAGAAAVVRLMPAAKLQVDATPGVALTVQPLTLYGYEASPFVRPVREKLCSLGLPHVMVNCARGSAQRAALMARTGRQFQVPYLVDPNTGVELFESIEIRKYLDRVYTTSGYTPLK